MLSVITFTNPGLLRILRFTKPMKLQLTNPKKLQPINLKWSRLQNGQKNIANDLYQAAVISVFAIAYLMLGKKILKIAPPSIQKFDLEEVGKLVAIVAMSEMTR